MAEDPMLLSRFSVSEADDPAYLVVKEPGSRALRMRRVDVEACTACGLRGHVAGDPVKCFQPISIGLGGEQPDQGRIGR